MKYGSTALILFFSACLHLPLFGVNGADCVVQVVATSADGHHISRGTGFIIKLNEKNYLATCYHVINGYISFRVEQSEKYALSALTLVYTDPCHDVALFEFSCAQTISPLVPGNELIPQLHILNVGEIIGFPRNNPLSVDPINFTSPHDVISSHKVNTTHGPLFDASKPEFNVIPISTKLGDRGMSGAPIIVRDKVVGIFFGSLHDGASLAWAMPADFFRFTSLHPLVSGTSDCWARGTDELKSEEIISDSKKSEIENDPVLNSARSLIEKYNANVNDIKKLNGVMAEVRNYIGQRNNKLGRADLNAISNYYSSIENLYSNELKSLTDYSQQETILNEKYNAKRDVIANNIPRNENWFYAQMELQGQQVAAVHKANADLQPAYAGFDAPYDVFLKELRSPSGNFGQATLNFLDATQNVNDNLLRFDDAILAGCLTTQRIMDYYLQIK